MYHPANSLEFTGLLTDSDSLTLINLLHNGISSNPLYCDSLSFLKVNIMGQRAALFSVNLSWYCPAIYEPVHTKPVKLYYILHVDSVD